MSWFDTTAFTTTFVTLLVIFGPPGSIPIFLALTAGLDARERNAAARRAALVALGVIASFAVFALSDLVLARHGMDGLEEEREALSKQVPERMKWIEDLVEGRRDPQQGFMQDVDSQVARLASLVMKIRNVELLRSFGWLRIVDEFVVPIALAGVSIVWLAVRIA